MLCQEPPASLVLGGIAEVRIGDDPLRQSGTVQQRPQVGPEAAAANSVRRNSATISASLPGRSRRIPPPRTSITRS
jgi:hypothetical protein